MNTMFNAWISIGKRQALPPIDIDLDCTTRAPQEFNPSMRHQRREVLSKKKEVVIIAPPPPPPPKPQEAPQITQVELDRSVESRTPSPSPELTWIPPTQTFSLHAKVIAIKDLVHDLCLNDEIKVKKYNALDDRQKSLMNKIITYKFQADILDVIDTGGVKNVPTEEYLLDNPSQNAERTLLHLRLRLLCEAKFARPKSAPGAAGGGPQPSMLVAHYFGVAESEDSREGQPPLTWLFREIDSLRAMAAKKLATAEGIVWLRGMRNLLHDLALVPQDVVVTAYKRDLDKKLTRFFYDEHNDAGGFFPKLKVKLKEKKVVLPLTVKELKNWDLVVVKTLKAEISVITNYLGKEIRESSRRIQFISNSTDVQKKLKETTVEQISTINQGEYPREKGISV